VSYVIFNINTDNSYTSNSNLFKKYELLSIFHKDFSSDDLISRLLPSAFEPEKPQSQAVETKSHISVIMLYIIN
jgi:hypothetical protein